MKATPILLVAMIAACPPVASAGPKAPVVCFIRDEAPGAGLGEALRGLKIAEHRVHAAERTLESTELSSRSAIHFAERELEMARFDREKFEDLVRPRRIAEKELQLQRSKDRAREAAEELAQIEIMYGEQDLDDKTAEFVIGRGRRSAERSARDVELQERALEAFVSYELRKETDKLHLGVERKEVALLASRRDAETEVLQKQIGLMEAHSKLKGLQEKVAKLKREAAEGATEESAGDEGSEAGGPRKVRKS